MDIKTKALKFALNAHIGQVRKNEPEKPMIIHPIGVGKLLEEYGYDDNVVAAGYLHDTVEDTKVTIEDIEKEFGKDIKELVDVASEPDKTLSWEERKTHTINLVKTLPLRKKLVISADKINNLEDIMIKFQKEGKRDFSKFKRGEEKQKWYYEGIYHSLIENEDENLPIFKRLKEILEIVFEDKKETFLEETIFQNDKKYYDKLKKLHAQKQELHRLKQLINKEKPFVIEFSGTPRTGKTTTINNLYDFFKKGGFKVLIVEEFTTSSYFKDYLKGKIKDKTRKERNIIIIEETYKQLKEAIKKDVDIIFVDRSINDRQIWNYMAYSDNEIEKEEYEQIREKYRKISKKLIDAFVLTSAEPLTSLKRDYLSSLALEKRNYLNIKNIETFNKTVESIKDLLKTSTNNFIFIDSNSIGTRDVAVKAAEKILPAMRKEYIKALNKKYKE